MEVKASDLPLIAPDVLLAFLLEMGCEADAPQNRPKASLPLNNQIVIPRGGSGSLKWTTDAGGLVVDGRDAFLAWCIARTSGDPAAAFDLFAQHAELARPKRDGRVTWTQKDAGAKAKIFAQKQRRGALPNRKAKGRPANGDWSGTPWSVSDVEAFNEHVRQLCLKGELSRAEMKVSVAMASFLPERGQCFAAVERIAAEAEVSPSAVRKARPALERHGLWRSAGSTGKTAVYVPRTVHDSFTSC